ncbi:BatD family protein [Pseudoalteromonas sp. N1230-9]|uniref:BatD family protein n=1 Tax=Pseudoalteromonas sp. N1230-9 TaxID=2907156 RepID=UPI002B2AEC20|nr:BatD family protein [Pseudoalteromonas sp. N1230-9]
MVMRLLCCLLLIAAAPLWAASQLQASVDKNPVLAGEFFILTISVDDSVKSEQPDTSVLLKDFVVGPTSVSSRTNIVNGEISKQTNWSVKLMTRKEGTYTIPAFTVAGVSSKPIELEVSKRSQNAEQNKEAFIKTSVKSDSLYVQEAGVYTVKLYLDNNKELLDGNLSTPQMDDAQLNAIGKQSESYELIDGKRYLVITREYLLQPQKSGQHTITAPVFNGRIRQNYRQMEISAIGEDLDLDIKPIPENYQGAWLPSELVNLDEQWQPKDDTVEVGTPITRTITLTALGVTKEQLPDIEMPQVQGFRSYPDEKETNHLVRDGRVISQQTASYALLPQTPGTFTLPEVKLPWFNTKINRISYATIPARTITVIPSTNALTANTNNTAPNTSQELTGEIPAVRTITEVTQPIWLIIVAAGGYLLWIATLVFFLRKRPVSNSLNKNDVKSEVSSVSLSELKKYAKTKDYSAFYLALSRYAKHETGQTHNAIDTLMDTRSSSKLSEEIAKLRAKLYSSSDEQPDLAIIINGLAQTKRAQSFDKNQGLKKLYD